LRDLGDYLTRRYPGWGTNYATRFVLTGEPSEESPLWTESGPDGQIVIHAAPWISPESVKNVYRSTLQSSERSKRWSERYSGRKVSDENLKPKRRRRLPDKSLKLLRFITGRIDYRGRRPNGREVAAQWDAAYPDWAYRGNTRIMWRDYKRALRAVAPETVENSR
jgi:hypothetical protein